MKVFSSYDTDSGQNVSTEKRYRTRGMIVGYTVKEIGASGGTIKDGSFKCLIITNECEVIPLVDDLVKEGDNRYLITSMHEDALGAMYHITMEKQ